MNTSDKKLRQVDLSELRMEELEALDPSARTWSGSAGERRRSGAVEQTIFKDTVAFRIHFIEPDESKHTMEQREELTVRMLCSTTQDGQEHFRMELTSENDIFFFYVHL